MVISDRLKLAFIHVPKCAGTTIRRALKPFDDHGLDGWFDFPDGGRQHQHHLPLVIVRRHYPDLFAKIQAYESYAVLRQPRERFASALLQHLRSFRALSPKRDDIILFQRKARELCAVLTAERAVREPELMHFLPQRDFVICDGETIVRHLFRFDDLVGLSRAIRHRHGVPLELSQRANEGRTRKGPKMERLAALTRPVVSLLFSPRHHQRMRAVIGGMAGTSPQLLYRDLYKDTAVARFVDDFYAGDAQLFQSLSHGCA